jgi:pimeloyl-ACP methyl ester carboxylesterase
VQDDDFAPGLLTATLLAYTISGATSAYAAQIKNVVIVHGALADGSGWRSVYDRLIDKGYKVTIVQAPMTSLREDVEATQRILDMQDGPSILVGHSYGGIVITEAGSATNVAGLVYIAAFQPDAGESLTDLAGKTPPPTKGLTVTQDGFLYLDPRLYAQDFAGDLPRADAMFMAHSQVLLAKAGFEAKIKLPAWRAKKSWALIATEDRAIHPDLQRTMAERADSQSIKVKASHSVFISQPDAVAGLIEAACKGMSNE